MNYRGQFILCKLAAETIQAFDDKTIARTLFLLFKLFSGESPELSKESQSVRAAFNIINRCQPTVGQRLGNSSSTDPSLSPSSKGDERKEPKERRAKNNSPSHTLFARFWEVYPRKVGKVVAEKAFLKCVDGLPEEDAAELVDRMIDAVRSQSRSAQWQDDERFIPHPSTWLNQHRWEDETAIDPIEAAAQAREDACAESNRQMAEIAKRFAAPEERA